MSSVEPSGKQEYQERLRAVLDYIDTHLAEEMSVETLAGVACFSVFHFHRLFTAMMGESLSAYIRRLRLEWAANNLEAYREMSVTEIALNCGFSSSATFARAFKQHFGLSASDWRNTSGKNRQTKSKTGQAQSKPGKDSLPDSLYGGSGFEKDHHNSGRREGKMELKTEIREMEPLNIAYVRQHGGYEEQGIHRAYEKLMKWAGPRGLMKPGALVLGVPLDNPEVTPAEKCRYDAGLTVPPGTEAKGEVGIRELPGGRHAVIRYEGPKEGITAFYDAVYGGWLPESGFLPADRPAYEIYHQPAGECSEEGRCLDEGDHHIFDLCLPVEPA